MGKVNKIYQNGTEYEIQDKPLTEDVNKIKTSIDEIKTSINGVYKKPADGIGKNDLNAGVQASLAKADSSIQNVDDKLGKEEANGLYQPKGEYLTADDLEDEIYYIHFNIANAKACEDAYEADPTADLSGYDIFGENNEADIITKLKENRDLHAILIDEDGNHYQLYSTEITKKGKFKVKFTAPTSSKKMIKVEFSTAANDFTSFDKTAIDIGDNELLAIKYLYNYDIDDANKVYKNTDPVIYPSQYLYRKDEIDGKGFLTAHQSLDAYALKTEIPSLTGYATESWVESKNYLTEHQSLVGYATEDYVNGKVKIPELDINSEDGTYILKAIKNGGNIEYQWIKE